MFALWICQSEQMNPTLTLCTATSQCQQFSVSVTQITEWLGNWVVFFPCVRKHEFLRHETFGRNVPVVKTFVGKVSRVQDDIAGYNQHS